MKSVEPYTITLTSRSVKPLRLASVALIASMAGFGCGDESMGDDSTVEPSGGTSTPSTPGGSGTTPSSETGMTPAAHTPAGTPTTEHEATSASDPNLIGDRRIPFAPANDRQFAEFFIEHHRMAIEMANAVLERGERPEVREMAQQVVADQTAEIAILETALAALADTPTLPAMPEDPHLAAEMGMMTALSGVELDTMFLIDMMAHHAGALAPAHRAVLQRPELQNLAGAMFVAQAREIGEMRAALDELGVNAAGEDHVPLGMGRPDMGLMGDRRLSFTPANDVEFVDFFIAHHMMAIEMADEVIARGQNAEVRGMAEEMKAAQAAEIETMRGVRAGLMGSADPAPMPEDPHMAPEMQAMSELSGAELDRMFLLEMIPHHASGMPTAHRALPHVTNAELRTMTAAIYKAQGTEIGEMRQLLDSLGEPIRTN